MANGFMNPFGTQTTTPFLFGEDPASRQALESYQAAGDVAQQIIGLQDPRSLEAQQEMEMVGGPGPLEAFLPGGLITKGPRIIGGLQKLSRFKPSATPSQLPVPRTSQLPDVPGGRPPAVRTGQSPEVVTTPPSTFVRGTGPRPIDAEVSDVTKGGGLIPTLATMGLGTAMVADQVMQDPSQEQVATAPQGVVPTRPKSPIEIHTEYLKFLEEQGVSADERTRIAGRMLEPFLKDPVKEAESKAAFDRASARREAELEFDEAARRRERLGIPMGGDSGMTMADYRALARQGGMKGSAVEAFAKNAMKEQQMKERKAEADIAATEALIKSRLTPKPSTVEKDLADIEARFLKVGVPFRNPDGTLTQDAQEALLAKGRIGEGALGSGLEETILLDRQGNQRRVPNDQVEEALASGYTRFVDEA